MIEKILLWAVNKWQNREKLKILGAERSPLWPKIRRLHIQKQSACVVCGEIKKNVEVHHIQPFHLRPELELSPSNLLTLCESGNNGVVCHRFFGHLGNYKKINKNVIFDAETWKEKLVDKN